MSEPSIIKEYAEKVVPPNIQEKELILNQYHAICRTINDLAADPKMTARAWARCEKAVGASLTGEKVKLQNPVEEAMVKNLMNREGIKVHMIVNNEMLLEAAKRELAHAKKVMQDRMAAAEQMELDLAPVIDQTSEPKFAGGDENE